MDGYLPVTSTVAIPRAELSWRFSRASGPGGQSVNTADSRVELRFDLAGTGAIPEPLKQRALDRLADQPVGGELVVTAAEHRSQLQNRRAAEARLVATLAAAVAPPAGTRRPTRPSKGAVQRRLDTKRHRSQTKRMRGRPDE
jgi:ribosome-associated protein